MEESLDSSTTYNICTCIWTRTFRQIGQEPLDNAANLPSLLEDYKEFLLFGQELLDTLFYLRTRTFRHFIFMIS